MTLEEKPPLFETLACVYFFNNDVIKGFFLSLSLHRQYLNQFDLDNFPANHG